MTDECALADAGTFQPPPVNHCPACGGKVESTDTPTMYRCAKSGMRFFVEV